MLFTPERITELKTNEIFVFGSNLQGYHKGGAAKFAMEKFGAKYGQGVGLQGNSYAIPTIQGGVVAIKPYVDEFIDFATRHSELTFYVTKIGCGIAGYNEEKIAPLFHKAFGQRNILLPRSFFNHIVLNVDLWREAIREEIKLFIPEILSYVEPLRGNSLDVNLSFYARISLDFHYSGFRRFSDAISEVYYALLSKSSPTLQIAVKIASVDFSYSWCIDYGQYIVVQEICHIMEEYYNSYEIQQVVRNHPELAEVASDCIMI